MPDWKKLIASKIAVAQRGAAPGKINANVRVPAGQTEVKNFPVLDMGMKPTIAKSDWSLRVYGLVEN